MNADSDADLAALIAIVGLPGVGPARGRWLLGDQAPAVVLKALQSRRLPVSDEPPTGVTRKLIDRWFAAATDLDGRASLDRHRRAGVEILTPRHSLWPFSHDPDPPLCLFASGHLGALGPFPTVSLVGTRRCTSVGRRVAFAMGRDLAQHGVRVVSGLALGIDGAAHSGSLSPVVSADDGGEVGVRPVAVVATGLDVVYPAKNDGLWAEVVEHGLVVSEAPLGTKPERWRFPARNRLIAGLSDLTVVVESHEHGGALLTVDEACARGVPVAAVPGAVTSAASNGTNALLIDGCPPVRDAADVLGLLGTEVSTVPSAHLTSDFHGTDRSRGEPAPMKRGQLADSILAEIGSAAVHIDTLVAVSGSSLARVLEAVRELAEDEQAVVDGSWVVGT